MRLMKYVENANPNDATVGIAVGDDRPTIYLGGAGEMSDREISNAIAMGHVLVEVDDDLAKMKIADLDAKAEKLGVEVGEDDGKEEKLAALRTRLAAGPEDPSERAIGGSAPDRAAVGGTGTGASGGPTGTSTGGGTAGGTTTGGTTT
jgi:uncharacterized protein YunC (DUF1805 family)